MRILFSLLFLAVLASKMTAQTTVEGYVFEEKNRGYLNQVKITVLRLPENAVVAEAITNLDGAFSVKVAEGSDYRVVARKDVFFDRDTTFSIASGQKPFLKIEMRRKPGYLFDVTLAEKRISDEEIPVDAIQGADIEIFNRTTMKSELVLKNHPNPGFQFTFEQGNHYTLMIRKRGYLTRRIEAFVNVEGCIICVDGVSDLRPGVSDNLTEGNTMGSLLANLDMEKAAEGRRIQLRNIYYDYNKDNIRPDAAKELDKAVVLLKDNPSIKFELGSHTDARGSDTYNMDLSGRRARSAVAYILSNGLDSSRLASRGYGEAELTNRCGNGVQCSEADHQLNRRTELKIVGVLDEKLVVWPTLEEIVREEEFEKQLKGLSGQKEYRAPMNNKTTPKKPEKLIEKVIESNDKPPKQMTETFEIADRPGSAPMPEEMSGNEGFPFLEANFTGFAIEFAKLDERTTSISLPTTISSSEVFVQPDTEGNFCYFLKKSDNLARTRTIYNAEIVKFFPSARLVEFKNGKKTYTK